MLKIPLFLPVPDFIAVLALTPLLFYRKIKFGYSFMRIKLTRGLYAIVDVWDYFYLKDFKWYVLKCSEKFYAVRSAVENGKRVCILMHRQIMNPPKDKWIDHDNHNGLDNRRCNLREASIAQNNRNRRKRAGRCSSIYKGVWWNKYHNKWSADIMVDGQRIFLGYFDSEIEAAKAYDNAAKLYHKEFASLNFS